ncbi:MAG: cob(I)yrinic acid a,c-diamide adenosyltransferase [Bacteroidales bacterium]|nr:cob(I)yrinic acid a,c-diamide adenosyltransferase [Bacteroidales bacterium]
MAIYTKTGDQGTTSLVSGTRVSKCDKRVQAYGDVDELISYIGVLRCHVSEEVASSLLRIQTELMNVAAWLACDVEVEKMKPLSEDEVKYLETEIDRYTEILPKKNCFIIPSPPLAGAECHVARTICRRAERKVVAIEKKHSQDGACQKYLNRLSDYLFMLARFLCDVEKAEEKKWIP